MDQQSGQGGFQEKANCPPEQPEPGPELNPLLDHAAARLVKTNSWISNHYCQSFIFVQIRVNDYPDVIHVTHGALLPRMLSRSFESCTSARNNGRMGSYSQNWPLTNFNSVTTFAFKEYKHYLVWQYRLKAEFWSLGLIKYWAIAVNSCWHS